MSEPRPMPKRPQLHVQDVPDRARFEARISADDALAGFIEYRLGSDWIALLHTEVLEAFQGQGIGGRLVRAVFEDLRARELPVLPRCPFILAWLQKHPEQHDILFRPLEAPDPDEPSPA